MVLVAGWPCCADFSLWERVGVREIKQDFFLEKLPRTRAMNG
jgi:hypothetical protein